MRLTCANKLFTYLLTYCIFSITAPFVFVFVLILFTCLYVDTICTSGTNKNNKNNNDNNNKILCTPYCLKVGYHGSHLNQGLVLLCLS